MNVFQNINALFIGIACIASVSIGACHDHPLDSNRNCTEILVNPSFESITGSTPSPGHSGALTGVEGWMRGPGAPQQNSPDIYDSPQEIPRNFMGNRTPLDGNNYAGISQGRHYSNYLNESLMGTLQSQLPDGEERTYTVSAWFSSGSVRRYPSDIEILLYNSQTREELQVVDARVSNSQNWEELSGSVEWKC
ncbi:MAG: hypothetical protein AB7H80_01120 [Candidatus Kapaibacterium sp.]